MTDDTERTEKAADAAAALQRELTRRLRPFAITYGLVSLPRILRIIASKGSATQRVERILSALLKPTKSTLKLAAFPALLPFIYQTLLPLVKKHTNTAYSSELTALLASPVTLLLPHGLRVYLALYAVTSAMTTFFKSASPKDQARKVEEGRAGEKEWRDYLPPVTLINALGNSWMVWSWFHEKGVFPKSYEKLILEHAPHYVPTDKPAFQLRDFLETTLNPALPNTIAAGGHHWLVCQTMHPGEPSCTINHLKAWRDGVPQVAKWVAGFGALSTLIGFKKRILSEPVAAIRDWVDYTTRGVLYVNGSVQTVWAVACVLQRIFPGDFMPKNRWVINGSVASLWVYALPKKRQTEISVYVGRIGALSLWRAWRKHGGPYLPHGELLLFAAGWSALTQLREGGWRIEGLMRRAIIFVEGGEKALEQVQATWSPDVSRTASAEDLALRKAMAGEGGEQIGFERNRVESYASTMSAFSDSGFNSEEDDDSKGPKGDIKITSRLRMTSATTTNAAN